MKRIRLVLAALGASVALYGAIDGTVVNRTLGKPQPGVSVTLVKPGAQGMQTLGTTVSDASGHFVFEHDQPGGGPQLLQAAYGSVNYNKLMTPNIPTSNVELDVYEPTQSPSVGRISQHMMLIEPTAGRIAVSENIIIQNDSTNTYNNSKTGGIQFYLPPVANGQVQVQVQGPQGMPLPRAAEKTEIEGIFKVDYPLKPGETQFEIDYVLPVASPFTLRARVINVKGMPTGPLRLIAPSGVTLAGSDIQSVGTEPKTQASIFTVMARDAFSVDISGTGSLRSPAADQSGQSDSPQVTEGVPRIYTHIGWLAALALTILAAGLVYLFLASPVRSPYGK